MVIVACFSVRTETDVGSLFDPYQHNIVYLRIMIFILTGQSGSGKTTLLNELAEIFRNNKLIPGGFTAPGTWLDGKRSGFMLNDLLDNKEYPLAESGKSGAAMYSHFGFFEQTLEIGNKLLARQATDPRLDMLIVDEVGPFELHGMGWAPSLDILSAAEIPQIWTVRAGLVETVAAHWNFKPEFIFFAPKESAEDVFNRIADSCNFPVR
ncbi:MAG: hypothetical protein HGA37_17245 [Lentimicrobium sp.]|nr:hypothetical protein [Lentimicrobium sp.]